MPKHKVTIMPTRKFTIELDLSNELSPYDTLQWLKLIEVTGKLVKAYQRFRHMIRASHHPH